MGKFSDWFRRVVGRKAAPRTPPEIERPIMSDARKKRLFPFAEQLPPVPPLKNMELKILKNRIYGKPPGLSYRPKKR